VRESGKKRAPFIPPENLVSMVGLSTDEFAGLMGALGYRRRVIAPVSVPVGAGNIVLEKKPADTIAFQWKGRMTRHTLPKKADKTPRLPLEALPVALRATSPFAALAALKAGR
jgi:hypothetical protein